MMASAESWGLQELLGCAGGITFIPPWGGVSFGSSQRPTKALVKP